MTGAGSVLRPGVFWVDDGGATTCAAADGAARGPSLIMAVNAGFVGMVATAALGVVELATHVLS
ncbi:MAG TPA: hypothetical protein VII76_06100 [Acidimicrobiales bacterium]